MITIKFLIDLLILLLPYLDRTDEVDVSTKYFQDLGTFVFHSTVSQKRR